MDRLLAIQSGVGQPLREKDWEMIQNISVESLAAIIKSLCNSGNVILWGCTTSINSGRIYLAEGAVYVDGEIYHVAASNFAVIEEGLTFLQPSITTSELRTFKDNSQHNVYQLRRYQGGHAAVIPTGGINYTLFSKLSDLQVALIMANIASQVALTGKASVVYNTGFSSATTFQYLKIESNNFNTYMLIGAFDANTAYGKLCTLANLFRPSGDFFGTFWSGGESIGTVRIKENGEVWINGASTTSVNYITLIYPKVFDDPVNYDTPTGQGSQ